MFTPMLHEVSAGDLLFGRETEQLITPARRRSGKRSLGSHFRPRKASHLKNCWLCTRRFGSESV
jgi:hypothetical protein